MPLQISKVTFCSVLVLLLLLPLLVRYQLLTSGVVTEGEVIAHEQVPSSSIRYRGNSTYAVIRFSTDDHVFILRGRLNAKYELGEKVNILYEPENPHNCEVMRFTDLYLGLHAVIPVVLTVFWVAFYYALLQLKAAQKMRTE